MGSRRHGLVRILCLLAAAAALTSCGSSGRAASSAGSPNSDAASSSVPGPAATVATTASGTPANSATVAAVTAAFATFFDFRSTEAETESALQDGDRFAAVLTQQGAQSYAQKSSATVSSVTLISANTAKVTFSVLVGGTPLLPDAPGFAVRVGGRWRVAATTFCGLLALQGDKAAVCKDPSVTALPQ